MCVCVCVWLTDESAEVTGGDRGTPCKLGFSVGN